LQRFIACIFTNSVRYYTGCIKKKVIELQRAIVSELLCVWTRFFHIRKDHTFSCWMISSSCPMDKKWANTNRIKNVSQNRIFSPLRVGSKTIENEPLLVLKGRLQSLLRMSVIIFAWGLHRKLGISVYTRSSLISGNNTRVVFFSSQAKEWCSKFPKYIELFWATIPQITSFWGNMTSRKEYHASRDASKVYQSVSILLFSSMESVPFLSAFPHGHDIPTSSSFYQRFSRK
jgi:hypothetical protein